MFPKERKSEHRCNNKKEVEKIQDENYYLHVAQRCLKRTNVLTLDFRLYSGGLGENKYLHFHWKKRVEKDTRVLELTFWNTSTPLKALTS